MIKVSTIFCVVISTLLVACAGCKSKQIEVFIENTSAAKDSIDMDVVADGRIVYKNLQVRQRKEKVGIAKFWIVPSREHKTTMLDFKINGAGEAIRAIVKADSISGKAVVRVNYSSPAKDSTARKKFYATVFYE